MRKSENEEKEFKYKIELGIGEFHLVFGALQEKFLANEVEMKNLVSYENIYDEVIEKPEKYNELIEQNKKLRVLSDSLYKVRKSN